MEITLNKDISISIGEKNAFLSWKKQITLNHKWRKDDYIYLINIAANANL